MQSLRLWCRNSRTWIDSVPRLLGLLLVAATTLHLSVRYNNHDDEPTTSQEAAAAAASTTTTTNELNNSSQQPTLPKATTLTKVVGLIVVAILVRLAIRIGNFLNHRYEALKIFDKGRVPSVPNKNPLTGNLFEILAPFKNLEVIEKYHRKLGKTYGMFYGPDPWIFTTDLDLLQKLFVSEGNRYIDIVQFRMPFITEMSNSLAQVQGNEWRSIRRALNPSFAHKQMKSDNVFEDIDIACSRLMDCIAGHPLASEANGDDDGEKMCRIVDAAYNFKKYTLEVIFRVAYGRDNGANMEPLAKDPLIETVHSGAKLVRGPIIWTSIIFAGTQRLLGALAKFTPIGRYIRYIHQVLDDSLVKRRRQQATGEQATERRGQRTDGRKMIDSIIESVDSNQLTEEKLRANLFFIFLAGFETTANTLTIMFWLLARHPQEQTRLRQAVARDGSGAQYLDWCIKETLRLYPAVPTAIGRVLHETIQWKGQTLFKGTTVNASIYSIHRSREYWGDDVDQFRPERFGEGPFHPVQYFAFGHGPRYCLGANLAVAELTALVSRLILKYRVETCRTTPQELDLTTPNVIHMIIEGRVDLKFVEISSL